MSAEHEHTHSHDGHIHTHGHASGDASRDVALIKYMLEHNRSHAGELRAAAGKLRDAGLKDAAGLIGEAVHYFDHGNDKLEDAVKLLSEEE